MLNSLSIKNFALIEDVALEFSGGLNVLTGETGAGKSIVVEALGLALGDKASVQQIRKAAPRLTVAASFGDLSPRVKALLKELSLPDGGEADELIVRREVESGGRSRCFVNDAAVNLGTLARLGELLVYVHGQHEHQLLLKPSEQLSLLDSFGRLEPQTEAVRAAYAAWRALSEEQKALSLSEQERNQRVDLYKFQSQELKESRLQSPSEEEELEVLLPRLKNAERLKSLGEEAYGHLYGNDGAALDGLRRVQRNVETLQSLGADLGDAADMLAEAVVRLEESARRLDDFRNGIDLDPDKLDETLSRLDKLARLKRKYGPTLADVIAHRDRIAEELRLLEGAEERTRDLSSKLAKAESELKAASAKLTQARASAAKKLAAAVEREFRECGLEKAGFDVSVGKTEAGYTARGADTAAFLFAPNPGEGWEPLADVASGGELSRVMLALKSVLAKVDAVPTLVFDEIDAGVGGTLGTAVGRKLAKLGKTHQVLCITHLASIAAFSQAHFLVAKEVRKDRTATSVRRLDGETRVEEIARMFGGPAAGKNGSVSVKHARELLETSKV
jgi:DNA repair protein RecN (Recombination protein N)